MGYTNESLQAQLAIAKRELAETRRHIARTQKRLDDLRGNEDKLCANIVWLEGALGLEGDKFAKRDGSPLVKSQPKSVVYKHWKV